VSAGSVLDEPETLELAQVVRSTARALSDPAAGLRRRQRPFLPQQAEEPDPNRVRKRAQCAWVT